MDYGGINAKIKAMRSRLLKGPDYDALSRVSSVQEVGQRLKEYPSYMKELSQFDGIEVHRGQLERKLILSEASDFKRIHSFISDHNLRQYLDTLFFAQLKEVIDFLLCSLFDEREIDYSLSDLVAVFGKSHIDLAKLKDSKTVSEFIENLRGSDFYSLLANVYQEDDEASLFKLQMQLDLHYYMHVWKKQKQVLDKKNREVMDKINGTEVDLRNIMWAYRFKKYYHVDNAAIYAYMIPVSYKLTVSQLSRMVEAANEEALLAEIQDSAYGRAFTEGFTRIEQVFYREMKKTYRKVQRASPNSLAAVAGYMYDKQMEIKNITALLEGVRYGLNPGSIMRYINLPESMEVSS